MEAHRRLLYRARQRLCPFPTRGSRPSFHAGGSLRRLLGRYPARLGRRGDARSDAAIYLQDGPYLRLRFPLLGSNAVTATTGDITSILFGVPGEGTTASTIVDGHPMAKKGERAGRALGAALMRFSLARFLARSFWRRRSRLRRRWSSPSVLLSSSCSLFWALPLSARSAAETSSRVRWPAASD